MSTQRNHVGFTLIELLVVISVIGALLAITIPAIRAVRSGAAQIRSVAYARDSASTIFIYASDNRDQAPVIKPLSDDPNAYLRITLQDNEWVAIRYFAQTDFWNAVMMSRGQAFSDGWFNPTVDIDRSIARDPQWWRSSDYLLSQSYMARPFYWTRGAEQRPEDRQSVMLSETAHPSSKCLLVESAVSVRSRLFRQYDDATPIAVSITDGSAFARGLRDATEPVANTLACGAAVKLLMTEDGVFGIDFRSSGF